MLNTEVDNSPGYSYSNRRSVGCEATSCTLPSARCQASLLAKRVLVFGPQVSLVPKRKPGSFELH
jgi:hypothetical protein